MRLSNSSGQLSQRDRPTGVPFEFQYLLNGQSIQITHHLHLPLCPLVRLHELAQHILLKHDIPARCELQLLQQLDLFLDAHIQQADQQRFTRVQQKFHDDFGTNKSMILLQLNKLNLLKRSSSRAATGSLSQNGEDEMNDNFRRFYFDLMHSSGQVGQALMSLENAFAERMGDLFASNQTLLQDLALKQSQEMQTFVKRVGHGVSEADVNLLSAQHFAQMQQRRDRCEDELHQCRTAQKEQFVQWIFNTYYDHQNGDTKAAVQRIEQFVQNNQSVRKSSESRKPTTDEVLQESFTINLGAQLKSTHNLRLSTGSVLDLCQDTSKALLQAHRLQTAMSLYSQPLNAIVMLVDGNVQEFDSFGVQFRQLCERTTEMHFAPLVDQLYAVSQQVQRLSSTARLSSGDIYTTRHSNLSQVHLAFHLVGDDLSGSLEINSRHPTILSLRNVLRMCYAHEVGVVSIPLLLINEMIETITIQWAMKRAELVLKCVKGFMIEMCSLSSERDEPKTVQFFVPKRISDDLFRSLATMVSTVFRVSNPLVLK
jgi:hypothetical protein